MNKILIAAALVSGSMSVLADGATYEYPQPFVSSVTRAEVVAQTATAAARGEIVSGELSYEGPPVGPAATRAEVRLALDLARQNHELASGEMNYVAKEGAPAAIPMASR